MRTARESVDPAGDESLPRGWGRAVLVVSQAVRLLRRRVQDHAAVSAALRLVRDSGDGGDLPPPEAWELFMRGAGQAERTVRPI